MFRCGIMTIRAGLSAALPLVVCASDVHYKYNARSELTRVTRAGEVLYGYEYDLAGNLIWSCNGSRTNLYERNCLNQYTTVSDSEGNVYRFTYDEDGNLVQDNRRVYIWDSGSRLEVSRPLPGVRVSSPWRTIRRVAELTVCLLRQALPTMSR